MSTRYLTKDDILEIHRAQIERYGGDAGILNEGSIASALGRLETGYYNDVIEESAALWESLAGNHPFQDGNKRTAYMAMDVFLKLNGKEITAEQQDVIAFIDARYQNKDMDFENLNAWLGENTQDRGVQRAEAWDTVLSSARAMVEVMPPGDKRDQAEAKLNELLGAPERAAGRDNDDDYER